MKDIVLHDTEAQQPYTTSKIVADVFGKNHHHTMRDIRKIIDNPTTAELGAANFGLSSYISEQNKELPCYNIGYDGFVYLVMGFTGKKAAECKVRYIAKFNEMRELIHDLMVEKRLTNEDWLKARKAVALDYKPMNKALKEARADSGKDTKFFHYCTEANMLNKIILGLNSKQYKAKFGLASDVAIRSTLTTTQLECFEHLQLVNKSLIEVEMGYEERKAHIKSVFDKKWSTKVNGVK